MPPQIISLIGLAAFITLAWGISMRRQLFPWRTVLAGLSLQALIALIMIRPSAFSAWIYEQANTAAANLIYFAKLGITGSSFHWDIKRFLLLSLIVSKV